MLPAPPQWKPQQSQAQKESRTEGQQQHQQQADVHSLSSSRPLLSIEHPAILSSIESGVKSVGGTSAITKILNSEDNEENRLELRYRPDDIYQHPIMSQSVKTQNILIKVVKNKSRNTIEDVQVIGVTNKVLRFRDMADMQYHPLPDSQFAKKFEETFFGMKYDKLSTFNISMKEDDLDNLDLMPPPIFSPTVLPHIYNGLVLQQGRLSYPNQFRNKFVKMLHKDTPTIPTSPSPTLDSLEKTIPAIQLCVQRLRTLFTERPITTRRAIFNIYLNKYGPGTSSSDRDNWRPILRFALPYICYMFKSGPFRDAYVLFGIDPRKDRKWARYQTAFFNIRDSITKNKSSSHIEELMENRNNHLFTGKDVGTNVVVYSFEDILDPILRKLIDEAPLREKFHENDGWYPSETLSKLKRIMRGKLLALRSGRIPSDEEFLPILEEKQTVERNGSGAPRYEMSIPPEEQDEVKEEPGIDDEQIEGENPEIEDLDNDDEQRELASKIQDLMNVIEQPEEHLISAQSIRTTSKKRGESAIDEDDVD